MQSEWVKTEIAKARKREIKEGTRILFPISIVPFETIRDWENFDADTGKDSAREIREYFIPDFSNWKDHDSYQEAFDRLVRDLKAETAKAYFSHSHLIRRWVCIARVGQFSTVDSTVEKSPLPRSALCPGFGRVRPQFRNSSVTKCGTPQASLDRPSRTRLRAGR
jgi:hypothetical protein